MLQQLERKMKSLEDRIENAKSYRSKMDPIIYRSLIFRYMSELRKLKAEAEKYQSEIGTISI